MRATDTKISYIDLPLLPGMSYTELGGGGANFQESVDKLSYFSNPPHT